MWTRWMWRAERAVNPSRPCSRPRLSAITTSPLPLVGIEVARIVEPLVQILQEGGLLGRCHPLNLEGMLIEKTHPLARRLVVAQHRLAAHRVGHQQRRAHLAAVVHHLLDAIGDVHPLPAGQPLAVELAEQLAGIDEGGAPPSSAAGACTQ